MSNYKITVTGLVQGIGYRSFVCKLANEYSIKDIRTQAELPYYTKGIKINGRKTI